MPLYEVAILELPTKKEREDGQAEKIIIPPTPVIASDPQSAAIAAVMDHGAVSVDRTRMQVLVRPFSGN